MISRKLIVTALAMSLPYWSQAQQYQIKPVRIQTRWAKDVGPDNALKMYPRPQLQRANWQNLNGLWDYKITAKDSLRPTDFDGKILVPYPVESALSGVKRALLPEQNLWYSRKFTKPVLKNGERLLLHFGAVDYEATIFVNGQEIGKHTGGYTAFSLDITKVVRQGTNELAVKVYDPTDRGIGPHGKQVLNPQNIYYTASSGIWQTVWLEAVPDNYINHLTITPDVDKRQVKIIVHADSDLPVSIALGNVVIKGRANKGIVVPILKAGALKLWSPANPYLYNFTATLGKDRVSSYFGMRKISVAKDGKGVDRIFLNNKPYFNLGTLDQGFWPDGLYTAPTDEALAFDIKAIKAMGFNTIRKHIKVEPARWYYYADKFGMLVWQDMVNPNQGLPEGSKPEFEREAKETLEQLHNYPSITTWVLFNEQWGSYDQKRLTEWLKQTDPSRIVNGHTGEYIFIDGKEQKTGKDNWVSSDMTDVHSYPDPMLSPAQSGKARIVGEFGGVGVSIAGHQWNPAKGWGYIQVRPDELKATYTGMTKKLKKLEAQGLSGSIYTEPFDVEGEENGLMTYDRKVVKIPFAELRAIHKSLNPEMGVIPVMTTETAGSTVFDQKYQAALKKYKAGYRDKVFLKQLAADARETNDTANLSLILSDYIATLKEPFKREEIEFLQLFVSSTQSPAFLFFQNNEVAIDKTMESRYTTNTLQNIIFHDEIEESVSRKGVDPDWNKLKQNTEKYGRPGEEIYLRAKGIFYLNKKDTINFIPPVLQLYQIAPDAISNVDLNNWAWAVFLSSSDKGYLKIALEMSKRVLDTESDPAPQPIDTYANLLYKSGQKEKAIEFEQRAVDAAKKNGFPTKEFDDVILKMKNDEPTW